MVILVFFWLSIGMRKERRTSWIDLPEMWPGTTLFLILFFWLRMSPFLLFNFYIILHHFVLFSFSLILKVPANWNCWDVGMFHHILFCDESQRIPFWVSLLFQEVLPEALSWLHHWWRTSRKYLSSSFTSSHLFLIFIVIICLIYY